MTFLYNLIGMALYTIVGLVFNNLTMKHIRALTDKVCEIDNRYGDRLWFTITMKDCPFNRFLVDVIFLAFWPAICIAAILKAEYEYDLIVHHSAFERRAR